MRHSALPVAVVGPNADLTYEYEALGNDASALSKLLSGSIPFSSVLTKAKRPVVIVGTGALLREDGAAISELTRKLATAAGCLTSDWNGYSVLHSSASAVGALDVGFVPGPTAAPLEQLKLVYLMSADDIPANKIANDAFVIYQGHNGGAGAELADLILPGTAYTEKVATFVNTEGRVQRTARAVDPPGDAREDWTIVVALSHVIGKPLGYESLGALRERMVHICPSLANTEGFTIDRSSTEMAQAALDFSSPTAGSPSSAPLASSMTNFYMSDPVSKASATMAKCVEAFGTRA